MKLAKLLIPGSVALAIAVAACANDGDVDIAPAANAGDGGAKQDGSNSPKPDGGSTQDAAPKVCISSCNIDQDCQNTCPPITTGVHCCDGQTRTCFASATASCPVQQQDSGTPPPY